MRSHALPATVALARTVPLRVEPVHVLVEGTPKNVPLKTRLAEFTPVTVEPTASGVPVLLPVRSVTAEAEVAMIRAQSAKAAPPSEQVVAVHVAVSVRIAGGQRSRPAEAALPP